MNAPYALHTRVAGANTTLWGGRQRPTFAGAGRVAASSPFAAVQRGGVGSVVGRVVRRVAPQGAAAVRPLLTAQRPQLHLVVVDPQVRRLQVRRADLRVALHVAVAAEVTDTTQPGTKADGTVNR